MITYRIFEIVTILGFLFYSLRQVLPMLPNGALHLERFARRVGLPPRLLIPAKFLGRREDGCSTCGSCSGCDTPAQQGKQVITLHRNK